MEESYDASYITSVLERMPIQELLKARTLDKTWKRLADEEIVHRHTKQFGQVEKSIGMRIKDLTLGELELKLAPIPTNLYNNNRYEYGLDGILDPDQTSCIWKDRGKLVSYHRFDADDLLNYLGRLVEAYPEDADKLKRGFYRYFNNIRLRLQQAQQLHDDDSADLNTMNTIMNTPEAQHYLNTPGPGPSSSRLYRLITSRIDCNRPLQYNVVRKIQRLHVDTSDPEDLIRDTLTYGMVMDIDQRRSLRSSIRYAIDAYNLTESEQRLLWSYYEHRCRTLGLNPQSSWIEDQPELGAMILFSDDIHNLHGGDYLERSMYDKYDRMITAYLKLATSGKNVNLESVRRRTAEEIAHPANYEPISEVYVRQRIGDRISHLPEEEQEEIIDLLATAAISRMQRYKLPINTD